MKILIIGSGGREHAIAWKIAQSPKLTKLFVAPGNAGTAAVAENVSINPTDTTGLLEFSQKNKIDLVVVGPEAPLAAGLVDIFQSANIPIFGPTRRAAEIESSKSFSKYLMKKYNIPCAGSCDFSDYNEAKKYLEKQSLPVVVKADGLAAGKGVVVAGTMEEAFYALNDFMVKKSLGEAGSRVIIEEYLTGREMSTFVFTDGRSIRPLVPACDYKTVFDGGKGSNTGGMGSYSPPVFATPELEIKALDLILKPAVAAMEKEGRLYKGTLYGGLMIKDGYPKALEFNARFGDPETQVVFPRLKTDLIDIMLAVANNKLDTLNIEWTNDACVAVVMASKGYPGSYSIGLPITGLDKLDKDIMVFHAGTKIDKGAIVTAGGRVLALAALGKNIAQAREKIYNNISKVRFEGCHYRKDIALTGTM